MKVIAINRFEDSRVINVAMAVEYATSLNIYSVEEGCFTVSGRKLLSCYVNSEASLRPGRDSASGRYVILELEPREPENYGLGRDEVSQCRSIRCASGKVIPPWEAPETPIAMQYKQVNGCQQCLVQLRPDGPVLTFFMACPRDYVPSQNYALYVDFSQGGNYQQGEMFGLIFLRSRGWSGLEEDDELLMAAGKVFRHIMYVYSIDVKRVYILGMAPEQADRVLDVRFPTKAALENPLRAKW